MMFRKHPEGDLHDELAFHIEMQTRKNVAAGMSRAEAARQARVQFGGATQVAEDCRAVRRLPFVETAWQDVRYALRGFRRTPALVLTVVATIALGLGLDTALFTLFNATYLRPIAVQDPKSLYEIYWLDRAGNAHDLSWEQYRSVLSGNPQFAAAFAYRNTDERLEGRDFPGTLISPEYFRTLGVSAPPVSEGSMVISHRAWQTRFASDPNIVGRKVVLRGSAFEIAGVAPAGFTGLGSRPAEFWAPLARGSGEVAIVVRLAQGASERQAQAGLTLWLARLNPNVMRAMLLSRATSKPFNLKAALAFAPILLAFSMVLFAGCANAANLMLARSLARRREIAIRLALGAARGRLIRQLLTESLLLAFPAAIAGIAVSEATIRICVRVLLATLPPGIASFGARIPDLHSDFRVFAFAFCGATAAAVLCGLAPALQATRVEVLPAAHPGRFRNLLVAAQVATCALLLVTAAVLLRGAGRTATLDATLSARNTIQITVQEKSRDAVLARLAADPAVESIAAASAPPVDRKAGGQNSVSPEYFGLYGIPILRGRNFTGAEARAQSAVAIVSESAARRLWPDRAAVGQTLRREDRSIAVIGIARDEISRWIMNGEDAGLVYVPADAHTANTQLLLGIRTDPEAFNRRLEATVAPGAIEQIRTLNVRRWVAEDTYFTLRIAYWLSATIGGLALLLTLSGVYGALSYFVSQRTKEIGIRIAMGATTRDVTGHILRQSMRLSLAGTAVGCVLALVVSKIAASALVMVEAFDVAACGAGVVIVLAACAAAAWFPSRSAARIDPLTTLRYD